MEKRGRSRSRRPSSRELVDDLLNRSMSPPAAAAAARIDAQPAPGYETPKRIHKGLILELPTHAGYWDMRLGDRIAREREGRRVPRVDRLPARVALGKGFATLSDVIASYVAGKSSGKAAFHKMLDIATQYADLLERGAATRRRR